MNPPPMQPLTRAASVPSLAKDARSARVIGRPLGRRDWCPELEKEEAIVLQAGDLKRAFETYWDEMDRCRAAKSKDFRGAEKFGISVVRPGEFLVLLKEEA